MINLNNAGRGWLLSIIILAAALASTACIVKLSSGPEHMADGKKLNPHAYATTEANVTVVVGTKLARHSVSDDVFPVQILIRNNSAEVVRVEASNFFLRDALGNEYQPVPSEMLKSVYSRVNFDYELARTTEFIYLLNSGLSENDTLNTNFYSHSSSRIVYDRMDMTSSSRIVDILYYELPDWKEYDEPLTMVVKNLRDRPPMEVSFSLSSR